MSNMRIKIAISAAFIFLIGIVFLVGSGNMKNEFPYSIEIVPEDNALWVINTTDWADKDCLVTISGDGVQKDVLVPIRKRAAIVKGLENGKSYKLTIIRSDFLGRIRYKKFITKAVPFHRTKYIVVVGASITKTWNLNQFHERVTVPGYFIGFRAYYEFDKIAALKDIIQQEIKPDLVIIKECATYFPMDEVYGIEKVTEWSQLLSQSQIPVALATVVPITRGHESRHSGRMESIRKFNASLRQLAKSENIPLLDLQKELADNSGQSFLAEQYADQDGLHLNKRAYSEIMDPFMMNFIKTEFK